MGQQGYVLASLPLSFSARDQRDMHKDKKQISFSYHTRLTILKCALVFCNINLGNEEHRRLNLTVKSEKSLKLKSGQPKIKTTQQEGS